MTADELEGRLGTPMRAYERGLAKDSIDRVGRLMAELAAIPVVLEDAACGPRGAAFRKVQGLLREAAEKAFRALADARHEANMIVDRHGICAEGRG